MGKASLPHNKRNCYLPYPDHYFIRESLIDSTWRQIWRTSYWWRKFFVYQWYLELSPSCWLFQSSIFHSFLHVNHRMIMMICLLNCFTPLNAAFVLSVTMVPTVGIHYMCQLMSRESSLFLDFVKISRIIWLTIIIVLLIYEVFMIILS